jgi:hypothetical protein
MEIPKPQPVAKKLNSYNTKITNEWGTPPELYAQLNNEFNFNFDPCPLGGTVDGLTIPWGTLNFVNCPYSNVEAWAKKCRDEQLKVIYLYFLFLVGLLHTTFMIGYYLLLKSGL